MIRRPVDAGIIPDVHSAQTNYNLLELLEFNIECDVLMAERQKTENYQAILAMMNG